MQSTPTPPKNSLFESLSELLKKLKSHESKLNEVYYEFDKLMTENHELIDARLNQLAKSNNITK